jgi:predicted phosphodiesterase
MAVVRIAILSDVHGNLEALRAVIVDAEKAGATEMICLGDVVGYGADPQECLTLVRANCRVILRGNHDEEAARDRPLVGYNPVARAALEHTRKVLCDRSREFLHDLPLTHSSPHFSAVHSSLADPEEFDYVCDAESAFLHFEVQSDNLCFCGHTHVPCIWERTRHSLRVSPPHEFVPRRDRRCLVNVGSVGQPRDGNPDACYVLLEPESRRLSFRRIPYDLRQTQRKIRKAGLPEFLAIRLSIGR